MRLNSYVKSYNPKYSLFYRSLWYFVNYIFLKSYIPYPNSLKIFFLRFFKANIGSNVLFKPCVNIKFPWNLVIGDDVWIGEDVWIDNLEKVIIGSNVCVSQGAMLLTGNHDYKKSSFDLMVGEIKLEEGVWIGAKSVVCPGVTCHSHSVLAVGSVATKDLDAYTIYQGNPAQAVRKREILG